jgi:DNA invertase Pin-like site-specific DNA recombinase
VAVLASYFYARVSAHDQNLDRQLIAASERGVPLERVLTEKLSGKDTKRPELQRLMADVQSGDTVLVESISRFARNTRDLLDLVEKLNAKGTEFVSLKENIDTTTPTGKFMLTVFGAVAELERGYILQRQAEGIAAARARGVHMGRPVKRPPENFSELAKLWERGKLRTIDFMAQTGLTETTLYRRLREHKVVRRK